MDDEKTTYQQKLANELQQWKNEIELLKVKADTAFSSVQTQYRQQIEDLEAKERAARKRLEELRQSNAEGWKDLKLGMDRAWRELGKAVQSVASRLR